MNERISFLVDRTSEIMPGVYSLVYESGERGVEFSEAALEKFVELIVRECANIYEGVYTDQQRPERIDKRIKEHFGVK
jgi:hypothetical protein